MDMPDLILVEDDATFARTLQRSFERRGYRVRVASSPGELDALLEVGVPTHAVVDLKLGTASGLPCVATLHARNPAMLIVVLTGYASIATAVEAIKLGARHYLVKPSNTDDIEAAFGKAPGGDAGVPVRTANRDGWRIDAHDGSLNGRAGIGRDVMNQRDQTRHPGGQ